MISGIYKQLTAQQVMLCKFYLDESGVTSDGATRINTFDTCRYFATKLVLYSRKYLNTQSVNTTIL